MLRRLKGGRDPDYDFFDRFGDPSEPSNGVVPPTQYPNVAINAAEQVRIVRVLPGRFQDEIRCELAVKDLTEQGLGKGVQFSALSYTWGGFVNPAPITLNGADGFPVSQNLYCCLQRLRSTGQTKWFWIDQICINQHDKQEKSLQVPLMIDIYTRASQVVIWLGDYAPGRESVGTRSHELEKIIEYASFGRTDGGLCWWRRLWVLQEYSLASKEPMVQLASEQIPWSTLCEFLKKDLEGVRSALPSANAFAMLNGMIERFSAVRGIPHPERTLIRLAWVFPQLICFDPRDKIYGLLGILAPEMKAMITTDYAQASVRSVFSLATYIDISHSRSLASMALARYKTTTMNLPSWVVDFVYPQNLEQIDIPLRIEFWLDLFQKPTRPWTRIAPQADPAVSYDINDQSLTITALDFDEALSIFPIVDTKSDDVPHVTSWRKLALMSNSITSRLVLKKEERTLRQQILAPLESQTSYMRLLSGDKAYKSPPTYSKNGIRNVLADAIVVGWLTHDAHEENEESVEGELQEDDAIPAALDGYFDHLAGDVTNKDSSSALFVTQKGFVGIGPQHMRRGDRIVLPYGSRYPMLLRKTPSSTWYFMGFAHVTGIGSNQLWTILPKLNLVEQRYTLE